jgi:hypothetical protein
MERAFFAGAAQPTDSRSSSRSTSAQAPPSGPILSVRFTATAPPQSQTEHSQTNDQRWHPSHDEVAVWREPGHGSRCCETGDSPGDDGFDWQLQLLAIALTCAVHGHARERKAWSRTCTVFWDLLDTLCTEISGKWRDLGFKCFFRMLIQN